jgi:protein-S-isoprenylcysteine O-methyltransferase Ste14
MMKNKRLIAFSSILSAAFTIGILYSTIQLPIAVNELLRETFVDYGLNWSDAEKFIDSIRPLGYLSLTIVIALIILGFVSRKRKFSFLGSLALYLPTFSYFASTMFFLAGIGVLRILWLPVIELSPGATWPEKVYFAREIFGLGDIVYLPYDIVRLAVGYICYISNSFEFAEVFDILFFFAIVLLSAAIFFLSCTIWLYSKFTKQNIITSGIYKYSRHPQYLSFILWTYALLLYDKYIFMPPKGGYFAPPPLLWLTVVTIVIAIALHEENDMIKFYGAEYIQYMNRTPFLIPLPKRLLSIILYPARKIFKKDKPRRGVEIFSTLALYYLILVFLSLLYNL